MKDFPIKSKSTAVLTVLMLSVTLIMGCKNKDPGDDSKPDPQPASSPFIAKCHEAHDKGLSCMVKMEPLTNSATSQQGGVTATFGPIELPMPAKETAACMSVYLGGIAETFAQTLKEEQKQPAQDKFNELLTQYSQDPVELLGIDPAECSAKTTDKEKYVCSVNTSMKAAKEKICKAIEDSIN